MERMELTGFILAVAKDQVRLPAESRAEKGVKSCEGEWKECSVSSLLFLGGA